MFFYFLFYELEKRKNKNRNIFCDITNWGTNIESNLHQFSYFFSEDL